jgi:MFS family permease
MSSSTTPPDPYGTGDERDRSSGSTPPPPRGDGSESHSSPPPPFGSTPSYGSTSGYGSTPPAYGDASSYGSTPPSYGGGDYGQSQSPYGYGYPKNSLGVWSLVLGLVGLFVCGIFAGIPAIIIGHKARGAVADGQANNPGMATAGIVLGWIATILSVLAVVGFILLVATGAFVGLEDFDPNSF